MADVVPVSHHSPGAEAAAAPMAHPAGADHKELAKGKCSEIVDLGIFIFPPAPALFQHPRCHRQTRGLSQGMEALDSVEQSGSAKSGWRRDPSVGLFHPKSPPGKGSSSPWTLSCPSLFLTLLPPWDEGHKGSTCHSCSPTRFHQPPESPGD